VEFIGIFWTLTINYVKVTAILQPIYRYRTYLPELISNLFDKMMDMAAAFVCPQVLPGKKRRF